MLSSYIMGNTVGYSVIQEMKDIMEERTANIDPGIAG